MISLQVEASFGVLCCPVFDGVSLVQNNSPPLDVKQGVERLLLAPRIVFGCHSPISRDHYMMSRQDGGVCSKVNFQL